MQLISKLGEVHPFRSRPYMGHDETTGIVAELELGLGTVRIATPCMWELASPPLSLASVR